MCFFQVQTDCVTDPIVSISIKNILSEGMRDDPIDWVLIIVVRYSVIG